MKRTHVKKPASPPMRFAHPFYTSKPPGQRTPRPGVYGQRIRDWASQHLGPIPKPTRDPVMNLADIIGAAGVKEITDNGSIRFHSVGDTGRTKGGAEQEDVAIKMTNDFNPDAGGKNPAFFLHLGDVIYDQNKDNAYRDQFYRPYKNYPGKIVAIAGNHDGETFPRTDPVPLKAFLDNFCAKSSAVPPVASQVGIFRETMTESGVYWILEAPFVQIVGLYSNIVDGPGFLEGAGNDTSQRDWLTSALTNIAKQRKTMGRKALIIAVHHPPYSNGGHAGSPDVLAGMDDACQKAGVMPDAILSGHAHNYQRHTRRLNFAGRPVEIPFVVAGCGGHNDLSPAPANGQVIGDHSYDRALRGYGYLDLTATPRRLTIDMWQVPSSSSAPFDSVSVDLSTNRLV